MDALDLWEEPRGPFRFFVWQPEAAEVVLPPTSLHWNQLSDGFFFVQLRCCKPGPNGDDAEFIDYVCRHQYHTERSNFLSSIRHIDTYLSIPLEYAGVSESGIQQIFRYILPQAQAIANDERNSNQSTIPLNLRLERCRWMRHSYNYQYEDESDEAEDESDEDEDNNALAHFTEESMHDSNYNPEPATKSSIEALQKFRLEDGSFASKEPCMICMEQLSSMVDVTCMPCSHLYHGDCIVQWLNTNHLCPLCRFPMPCVKSVIAGRRSQEEIRMVFES